VDRRKKGDLDGAISDYSKAIEINPRYVAAYNNRGVARKAMGDLDGAIADYNKALEIDPRYAFGYNNRGNARKAKGDIDGAISDYNKAIEIDPRDVSAYSNRGTARKTKGDIDGAISDYNKAIEIDPNNASGYNNLAWLLATNSRPEVRNGSKAVELARKAAELTSWQDPTKLGTLGAAYAEVGNFVEAIRWQQRALEFPAYAREYGEGSRQRLQLYNDRRPYREP
jgi:tetratricopeptide (TPR) repeat protein